MPITAGAASAKISELRSKLAIYDALKDVIRANYMPSDGGAVELRLARQDGTSVSPSHFEAVMAELDERAMEVISELDEWEGMTFEVAPKKEANVRSITARPPEEKRGPPERKLHGRRVHPAVKQT
jgi:hypothetical protein